MFRKLIPMFFILFVLSACIPGSELQAGIETPAGRKITPSVPKPAVETPQPTAQEEPTLEPVVPTPTSEWSQYWTEVQDPYHGIRFALPCFWLSVFPQEDTSQNGDFAFPLKNYPDEYVFNFPRSFIPPDAGAIKIDMVFMSIKTMTSLSPGASQLDFVTTLYSTDTETSLVSTQEVEINGQPALYVTTQSNFGTGNFYLFTLTDDLFLAFAPPYELVDNPDVQAILNSIAISPDVPVKIPENKPAPPPVGLAAPCIPGYEQAVEPTVVVPESNTACGLSSFIDLDSLVTAVQQRLVDRNYGSLQYDHYVNDPFIIGYWASESVTLTPGEVQTQLANSLLPPTDAGMTFTTDQAQFPPLSGMPPEGMFGPNVKVARVVYTEGWGADGKGSALLYFAQDQCDGYYWHGLVFSGQHFDQ